MPQHAAGGEVAARERERKQRALLQAGILAVTTFALVARTGALSALLIVGITFAVLSGGLLLYLVQQRWARRRALRHGMPASWPATAPLSTLRSAGIAPGPRDIGSVPGRLFVTANELRWKPSKSYAKKWGLVPISWGPEWAVTTSHLWGGMGQGCVTLARNTPAARQSVNLYLRGIRSFEALEQKRLALGQGER